MRSSLSKAIKTTLVLAVLVCGVYPLAIWGIGNLFFSNKAGGGIITRNGVAVGAELIGQSFTKPEYFHGRPSAAGANGYDPTGSSGSNLGPTNQKLIDRIAGDIDKVIAENPGITKGQVPVDLVTASGSGLDPHISPQGAEVQVERVAKARAISVDQVRELVKKNTEGPQWGIFGESAVHVLKLNLALDDYKET